LTPWISFTERSNKEYEFAGYEIDRVVDLNAAMEHLERQMEPASREELYAALGTLKLMTAGKAQDGNTIAAQIKVYAAQLAKYPADAALRGIERTADEVQWWPAWSELRENVEWFCKFRLAAMKAINLAAYRRLNIGVQKIPLA